MKSIFGEENQQFQYSAALNAAKPTEAPGFFTNYLMLEVFTAKNDDEALGIASRFSRICFPEAEGYLFHQFLVKKTEELTDSMVESNKHQSSYTRCICGTLLHCHKGTGIDTRRAKLEMAVYNLQDEGYTKEEITGVAEMYFPGEP